MKHMLVVMAHPDDESALTGGTLARYADEGWQIDLLCATGSERQKELTAAGTILGIHAVNFMGYEHGTLTDRTPGDIEDVVYKKILEIIPDIVITTDTRGFTHDPDHVKICYAVTYAFQKYAKWIEEKLKSQEPEEQIFPKLYYVCLPEGIATYAIKKKELPAEHFGKPLTGTPEKEITNVIDIFQFTDIKKKALNSYKKRIPLAPLMKHEYFIFRMHGTTEVFMGKNDHVADSL